MRIRVSIFYHNLECASPLLPVISKRILSFRTEHSEVRNLLNINIMIIFVYKD